MASRRVDSVRLPLPTSASASDAAIWRVDGRAITKADLGDFVLRYVPDRAKVALDQLLDEAVIDAEAAREGVTVSAATVRAATDAYMDDRRREARVQYGATTDFEAFLLERYGRNVASYRADAERLVRVLSLRDRLVRLDQLREDGVEVRVMVLPSAEAAGASVTSLRAGADMTLCAERAGARRPASPPPVFRGEIPEKELEAALFAAAPGDVLDPVPFDAAGTGRFWQVFKVTRAWRADPREFVVLRAPVEESILAVPVSEDEYVRWRRRAFSRHRVEAPGAMKGSIPTSGGR